MLIIIHIQAQTRSDNVKCTMLRVLLSEFFEIILEYECNFTFM